MKPGLLLLVWMTAAVGQQPSISNADVRQVQAAGGLEAAIKTAVGPQSGPLWVGYAVPKIPGEHNACCWNDNGRGCGLEGDRGTVAVREQGPVKLEGPTHVTVLLRFDHGSLGRLRTLSVDCPLDAGGLPFYWLSGVKQAESVAMLAGYANGFAEGTLRSKVGEPAVHAVAMHAGAEAEAALEKLAQASQSEAVRKSAMFWLASSRGRRGFEIVSRAAREDTSEKVREHAAFALTLSSEPEAIPAIIRMAKEDRSPHVRGQALFWLGQKAARQSSAAITDAIERDPDTEVKKKAVFALSQLPKDEGIPRLIHVAQTNANPAVRKQALFWLGQSRDARALEFFERILK